MPDTEEQVPTLTPSAEAAAINVVSTSIGEWSKEKGFQEDFEDADWLDDLVRQLNLNGDAGSRIVRIAERHRQMAYTTKLMLVVSELSEALEAQRDGDADDEHSFDTEVADAMIRLLDLAAIRRSPVGDIILKKMEVNADRPHKHGRIF